MLAIQDTTMEPSLKGTQICLWGIYIQEIENIVGFRKTKNDATWARDRYWPAGIVIRFVGARPTR